MVSEYQRILRENNEDLMEEHDWKHMMNDTHEPIRMYDHIDMDDNYERGVTDGRDGGYWIGAFWGMLAVLSGLGAIGLWMNGWHLPNGIEIP